MSSSDAEPAAETTPQETDAADATAAETERPDGERAADAEHGEGGAPDADTTEYTLQVYRGGPDDGELVEYDVPVQEGMVVLDAIHWIQGHVDPELAVRWNCKSGRCGSCSVEIDGMPKLACMTRLSDYDPDVPILVTPMQTFPVVKDLVTDVSWNYEVNETIEPFTPADDADFEVYQEDIERSREFRKCIECFLCQDVCHVLREHDKKAEYAGPRYMVRSAALHFHPEDTVDRTDWLKEDRGGVGYCNVTRCCSNVCPEDIEITDNAIIPQKELVVDSYDPLIRLKRALFGD